MSVSRFYTYFHVVVLKPCSSVSPPFSTPSQLSHFRLIIHYYLTHLGLQYFFAVHRLFFCNVTLPINSIRSWIITRIPMEFASSETCRINEFPLLPLRQCNNTQNVPWQYRQLHKYIIKSVTLPLETVRAGDHCDLKISRQILPLLFMFG